jgi:mannosyltransferase
VAVSGSQSLARTRGPQASTVSERPDRLAAGWLALIPGLITLVVTLYRIGVPSFTRDEGATLLAVHRSFPQLIRMLGNVDVVHTGYYALIWVVTRLGGSGELAARAPSAVAMAVAAAGVTLLGQRLASGRAGLAAGLLFAAFPSVSFYAENAREYAIVAALATIASYLLIRALEAATPTLAGRPVAASTGPDNTGAAGTGPTSTGLGTTGAEPRQPAGPSLRDEGTGTRAIGGFQGGRPPGPAQARTRYGWLAGYAAVLALLGLSNILSLLIIVAHAVTVGVWRRYRGGPGRPFVLRWLASVAVALIVAGPVLVIASRQQHQVHWIKVPGVKSIISMVGLVGPRQVFFLVVAVVAIALATGLAGGRSRLRADWPAGLWGLAVPWLVLPPALLLGVSVIHVIHPLYAFRYVAFCIPAAALLAGTALAALARNAVGWAVAAAALAIIVVAGLPAQTQQRNAAGHGYGIRAADKAVARLARPGDALLNIRYLPLKWGGGVERGLAGEYPYGLSRLHDISQALAPIPSATLGGTFAPTSVERQRLATVTRLWVASWSRTPSPLPPRLGFTLTYKLHTRGVWLRLYTRPRAAATGQTTAAAGRPAH